MAGSMPDVEEVILNFDCSSLSAVRPDITVVCKIIKKVQACYVVTLFV